MFLQFMTFFTLTVTPSFAQSYDNITAPVVPAFFVPQLPSTGVNRALPEPATKIKTMSKEEKTKTTSRYTIAQYGASQYNRFHNSVAKQDWKEFTGQARRSVFTSESGWEQKPLVAQNRRFYQPLANTNSHQLSQKQDSGF